MQCVYNTVYSANSKRDTCTESTDDDGDSGAGGGYNTVDGKAVNQYAAVGSLGEYTYKEYRVSIAPPGWRREEGTL